MNFKKAGILVKIITVVVIAVFVIMYLLDMGKTGLFVLIPGIIAIIFIDQKFNVCPSCGKYLGKKPGKRCPHCHDLLD